MAGKKNKSGQKNRQHHSQSAETATPDSHDASNSKNLLKSPKNPSKASEAKKLQQQYNYEQQARAVLKQKTQYQVRALFIKNFKLQARQRMTNVLQVSMPVLALCIMIFLREAVIESTALFSNQEIGMPIPFYYNMPLKALTSLGKIFNVTDCNEWYMYSFNNETTDRSDRDYFGSNEGLPMASPKGEGMLKGGNILEYPCYKTNRSSPYFKKADGAATGQSMNKQVYTLLDEMSMEFLDTDSKNNEIKGLDNVPDGMIEIAKANKEQLTYRLQMNDYSIFQYHRNNGISKIGLIMEGTQQKRTNASLTLMSDYGNTTYLMRPTEGAVGLTDRINQAYMRTIFNDTYLLAGQQFMPYKPQVRKEALKILNTIGCLSFPVIMSLGMPAFLYTIVLEKENRLLENMKINGLQMINYWYVGYVFYFGCQMSIIAVYLTFGRYVSGISFFSETHFAVILLAYTGWGMCCVSMAFLLSCFISRATSAAMIGYVFSIIMVLGSSTFCTCGGIYDRIDDHQVYLRTRYFFIPHMPYARIFYVLSEECGWNRCWSHWDMVSDEIFVLIKVLYFDAIYILILAIYLNEVYPQQFGVPKHPLFFAESFIVKYFPEWHPKIFGDESQLIAFRDDSELLDEDDDVKQERKYIYQMDRADYTDYPLVVKDIRKVYAGVVKPIIANKNITMTVKNGELFGLLGPNGAGKTTLITQLTGFYEPTSGNAWIGGFDIKTQLDIVRLQIGVCPQFDVLWEFLNVEEHLQFYARIKGVHPQDEDALITKILQEVQLTTQRYYMTKELPLGMRRRLSIAISMVSRPKIVFLDEPTTGLDPDTRRQLWNILQDCKKDKNRAMVLTTHSMEEADVLCNRIGIVNKGVLRCIGTQNRLKTLYGGGYHLYINCHTQKSLIVNFPSENLKEQVVHKALTDFIGKLIPKAIKLRQFNGQFVYQVPIEDFDAEGLFTEIETKKAKLKILDWGISQCSLDDVFTRICDDT